MGVSHRLGQEEAMECGKPGGKPAGADLPAFEPMTVGEAVLSSVEDCQRAANGLFGGNHEKWPYSLLGDGISGEAGTMGQRTRSSFAERVSEALPGVAGDAR